MKLNLFSGPQRFYILAFVQDKPVWYFVQDRKHKLSRPPQGSTLPVVAIIPDHYFFFYQPRKATGNNRKLLIQAAKLEMRHSFPPAVQGEVIHILEAGSRIVGCYQSKELESFLKRHEELISKANVVTTFLVTALNVLPPSEYKSWVFAGSDNNKTLVHEHFLEYFAGDEQELEARMSRLGAESNIPRLESEDIVSAFSSSSVSWKKLQVPIPGMQDGGSRSSLMLKAAIVLFAAGMIFCAGEYFKLKTARMEMQAWEQELSILYADALGPDPGPDPYGLLIYKASVVNQPSAMGTDLVKLLGIISRAAPEALVIESMSLTMDSGLVRASLDNYDQMESFLERLRQERDYTFTLDQAESSDGKVSLVFSFK